jgi:hypothetical protein
MSEAGCTLQHFGLLGVYPPSLQPIGTTSAQMLLPFSVYARADSQSCGIYPSVEVHHFTAGTKVGYCTESTLIDGRDA